MVPASERFGGKILTNHFNAVPVLYEAGVAELYDYSMLGPDPLRELVVRTAREADVACVVKQQRDGYFKVSLRSKGGTDVGSIALSFGGGGHRLAAGYTSKTGGEETIRALTAALRNGKSA